MAVLTEEQRAYFAERGIVPDKYGDLVCNAPPGDRRVLLSAGSETWYAKAESVDRGHGYVCKARDPILAFVHAEVVGWELDKFKTGWDNCFAVGYTP